MAMMARTLGWGPIDQSPRLNAASTPAGRDAVSAQALEAIEAHSQLDLALYAYAEKLFEKRWAAMCAADGTQRIDNRPPQSQ